MQNILQNILIIGQTGLLGSYLQANLHGVPCNIRFGEKDRWLRFFEDHKIDVVIHTARACKKTHNGKIRDYETMREDLTGMMNILNACGPDKKFIYMSTKVVLGITTESEFWMTPAEILPIIVQCMEGKYTNQTINVPVHKNKIVTDFDQLNLDRKIYAWTKLGCENLVKSYCKDYTIMRIWDIKK